ncbi:MAG: hypothetical protein HN617_02455 [Planctomycetaceae bacterium]|jgi:hypothetical protein|nr:hypothetical protein [Planctomycetaceae bacterium]MBT4011308.1 hypothetical protein [Planctomycetaceae bacterium]MBT4724830.1 hypothetical protein [Planctomycetaceae bacterium]MBT4846054.1 hypothetical protein [Planctomycetaceae bacterium]MBT5124845.1 hypothetical protein [Planctomycetaceae bacterium]
MKIVKNLVAILFFLGVYSLVDDVAGQSPGQPSLFNPSERLSRPVNVLTSQVTVPPTNQMYTTVGNTDRFHRPNLSDRRSARTINAVPFHNIPKSLDLQVRGLVMMRDNATNQALTSNAASETVLSTRDADMDTSGGVEITLGKTLEDKTQRIETVYWGLFTRGDSAMTSDAASGLNTLLNISGLSYNGFGNPLSAVFNSSANQTLTRSFEYHNVEWNFTSDILIDDKQSIRLLTGFRYFKADDRFNLNIDDVAYSVTDDNHLFGAQVGALWTKRKGSKLTYHIGVKTGVFFNAIDHRTKIFGAAGHAFIEDPAIMNWRDDFNEYSKKIDMSFLGQLELGFDYLLTPSCQLTAGYRVMGVTGMAFATDQIPASFAEAAEGQPVTADGSLIMHGAYIGLDWNF